MVHRCQVVGGALQVVCSAGAYQQGCGVNSLVLLIPVQVWPIQCKCGAGQVHWLTAACLLHVLLKQSPLARLVCKNTVLYV